MFSIDMIARDQLQRCIVPFRLALEAGVDNMLDIRFVGCVHHVHMLNGAAFHFTGRDEQHLADAGECLLQRIQVVIITGPQFNTQCFQLRGFGGIPHQHGNTLRRNFVCKKAHGGPSKMSCGSGYKDHDIEFL